MRASSDAACAKAFRPTGVESLCDGIPAPAHHVHGLHHHRVPAGRVGTKLRDHQRCLALVLVTADVQRAPMDARRPHPARRRAGAAGIAEDRPARLGPGRRRRGRRHRAAADHVHQRASAHHRGPLRAHQRAVPRDGGRHGGGAGTRAHLPADVVRRGPVGGRPGAREPARRRHAAADRGLGRPPHARVGGLLGGLHPRQPAAGRALPAVVSLGRDPRPGDHRARADCAPRPTRAILAARMGRMAGPDLLGGPHDRTGIRPLDDRTAADRRDADGRAHEPEPGRGRDRRVVSAGRAPLAHAGVRGGLPRRGRRADPHRPRAGARRGPDLDGKPGGRDKARVERRSGQRDACRTGVSARRRSRRSSASLRSMPHR